LPNEQLGFFYAPLTSTYGLTQATHKKVICYIVNVLRRTFALIFIMTTTLLPGQGDNSFSFLNHTDKPVEIPFSYQGGFIIVKAKVNLNHTVNLILDTGAENLIFFDKQSIQSLGMIKDREIEIMGSDLETKVEAVICRNILFSLEGTATVFRDAIVLEDDFLNMGQMTGIPIDGLLGGRSFWSLVLTIDYEKQKIILSQKEKFDSPEDRHQVFDLELENQKPYLKAEYTNHFGHDIELKLLVDTGSALGLMLFTETDSLLLTQNYIKGPLGKGLGGDIYGFLGRVPSLQIGTQDTFRQVVSHFQMLEEEVNQEMVNQRSGLLGNPILSRYKVIIDYLDSQIYLVPNKHFDEDFKFDLSGMQLLATGPKLKKFVVQSIYDGSPATAADIRKEDEILRIGYWPRMLTTLPWLTEKLMSKEGRTVRLVILRNGEKLVKKLTLRDYLTKQ